LIDTVIASVGGSIGVDGSGDARSMAPIVSATVVSVRPAMAMMSPASALSTGPRF
jgi:hypothetical protein